MPKSAKFCPVCGRKTKKPLYKKWWFYVLVSIGLFIILPALADPQGFKEGYEEGYNAARYGETYSPPERYPLRQKSLFQRLNLQPSPRKNPSLKSPQI